MSRVLRNGAVFKKAGVNLSFVYGSMPQEVLTAANKKGVDRAKGMAPGEHIIFFVYGLSCVMYPAKPFVPRCTSTTDTFRRTVVSGGLAEAPRSPPPMSMRTK